MQLGCRPKGGPDQQQCSISNRRRRQKLLQQQLQKQRRRRRSSEQKMGSSTVLRELQRELEAKASDLSKLQKGKQQFALVFSHLLTKRPLPSINPKLPRVIFCVYLRISVSVFVCFVKIGALTRYTLLPDIAKNHQVRKKYTIQLGENELVLKVSFSLSLLCACISLFFD